MLGSVKSGSHRRLQERQTGSACHPMVSPKGRPHQSQLQTFSYWREEASPEPQAGGFSGDATAMIFWAISLTFAVDVGRAARNAGRRLSDAPDHSAMPATAGRHVNDRASIGHDDLRDGGQRR